MKVTKDFQRQIIPDQKQNRQTVGAEIRPYRATLEAEPQVYQRYRIIRECQRQQEVSKKIERL